MSNPATIPSQSGGPPEVLQKASWPVEVGVELTSPLLFSGCKLSGCRQISSNVVITGVMFWNIFERPFHNTCMAYKG